MKVKVNKRIYYMDGYLNKNISFAKKMVTRDMDFVCCIDGMERSGKSVLAQQLACFCDPTFTIDRIAFTPNEFRTAIHKAKKYQAVIYDEAMSGLASRTTMSWVNIMLVKSLAEIGQKNLFVFIILPSFFELDKYPAIHRSLCLLHVYMRGLQRGYFGFYNYEKKKLLYLFGKKAYQYCIRPNFTGRFTNYYPVDEKEYRYRKHKSLTSSKELISDKKYQKQRDEIIVGLAKDGWTHEKIADLIKKNCTNPIRRTAITRVIGNMEIKEVVYGTKK